MKSNESVLHKLRLKYMPKLPVVFATGVADIEAQTAGKIDVRNEIKEIFSETWDQEMLNFVQGAHKDMPQVNVGVVLSGGQAPGGHNVISGLYDGLKASNPDNRLFGFLLGPSGIVHGDSIEITAELIDKYRNMGGFDIIGSGRTKIESDEQFQKCIETLKRLNITALVVIGGDDSNTNAALMAEFFCKNKTNIQVIGVPKTIDGDMRGEGIEISFGFDTAVKIYAELVGNICRDALSAQKYWHFIKLMGRSASHIALEAALQTHPNIAVISEEIAEKNITLNQIVDHFCDVIVSRAKTGKNFGVALIPEGLIEFIPEVKVLIGELNEILAKENKYFESIPTTHQKHEFINHKLSKEASYTFSSLSYRIQQQLLGDRDPHGNVQVSKIETERLIVDLVSSRLAEMKAKGEYNGKFSAQLHFFGYEGRCANPSNFDADYCYTLGYTACSLINQGVTGYICTVRGLTNDPKDWQPGGIPISSLMTVERRSGKDKPVIEKALVKISAPSFKLFEEMRYAWARNDDYKFPGPIQYFGPEKVCDLKPYTLMLDY